MYDGGFNVLFNPNSSIVIELVGKGFDGRELTREKGVHERYVIPWDEILFIKNKQDLIRNRSVSEYLVDDEEYKRTRIERIEFLNSIEDDKKAIEENVPETYTPVSEKFVNTILDDIVFELYNRKNDLRRDGLNTINIQGNFENGKVVPWEIFRPERLIAKDDFER